MQQIISHAKDQLARDLKKERQQNEEVRVEARLSIEDTKLAVDRSLMQEKEKYQEAVKKERQITSECIAECKCLMFLFQFAIWLHA
jgi:hypothetical protein